MAKLIYFDSDWTIGNFEFKFFSVGLISER